MREIYIEKQREKKGVNGNYKWEMGNFTHHGPIFY